MPALLIKMSIRPNFSSITSIFGFTTSNFADTSKHRTSGSLPGLFIEICRNKKFINTTKSHTSKVIII